MADNILDLVVVRMSSTGETVSSIIEYDHELNLYDTDDDGNKITTTTFYKGEEINILVQIPDQYNLIRIETSCGRAVDNGIVERTVLQKQQLFADDEEISLAWYAKSNPVVQKIYKEGSSNVQLSFGEEQNSVVSNEYPIIVDFEYKIDARSITLRHPTDMVIEENSTYPIGAVIWVDK